MVKSLIWVGEKIKVVLYIPPILPHLKTADKCGFLLNQICCFQEITYFVTPFGLMKPCLRLFKDFSLALRGYFLTQLLF